METATTFQAWIAQARRKMAKNLTHMILWKQRDMRARMKRPRTARLAKEARALKSLLAEAEAAGLLPPAGPGAATGAPQLGPAAAIE